MKRSLFYASFAALLTALTIKAAPAEAQPQVPVSQAETRIVQVADLDLGTEAGREALKLRLIHAAREVCGAPSPADATGNRKLRTCQDEVVESGLIAGARAFASDQSRVIAVAASR